MLGDSFFVPLFLLVYSIVYATSLITNLGEQYSLAFLDKKKQEKDDHVILMNENRPGTINICLYLFIFGCVCCVEALALRNKKEVEGRRDREREDTSKKKGGE